MPEVFWANAAEPAPNSVANANVAPRDSEFRFLAENLVIMVLVSFLFQKVQQSA